MSLAGESSRNVPLEISSKKQADSSLRRLLARSVAKWSPFLIATAALVLTLALVPPVVTSSAGLASGSAGGPSAKTSLSQRATRAHAKSGAGTAGTSGSLGSSSSAGGSGYGSSSGASYSGTSSAGVGGAQGSNGSGGAGSQETVTGAKCGPGVRQVSWTHYSPMCVPAWHGGNNGGATGQGVTAKTITLSYAEPNSSQEAVIQAAVGDAMINDNAYINDLQTYINYFNTQFTLYGRKVVLKPFQAQGDYLEEDDGQDLTGAQADATTAHDEGAFADVTFPLFGSLPYYQDLAAEHVIAIGPLTATQQWYEQYAPYAYALTPTENQLAQAVGDIVCQRMAGMPAIFAGSQYQSTVRKFGLITPDQPMYVAAGRDMEQQVGSQCGLKFTDYATYSMDPSNYGSESLSIVSQMKADGVTTVVCGCDPVFPIALTDAAQEQGWYPEWLAGSFGDAVARDYNQAEWVHAMSFPGGQWPVMDQLESYKVYETASGGKPPQEPYFFSAYYELLFLFSAIQHAGPDLNASSFEQSVFSLPAPIPGGQAGVWIYGPGHFTIESSFGLGWWDENAISNYDGKQGAYENCNSGASYLYTDPSQLGGPHVQLACFGH
ncbi:MAG: ABC transporter substrate-binding protein [Actinobacteria bacterium]|nr:ABC transporter substrate-binding protein [Actinomycetota bacterium]